MGGESNDSVRTLSSPVSSTCVTEGMQHESCYLRRFRRATGSDFLSAPRLLGRQPRRAAAAEADTSQSRPFFLQRISPARHSRAMCVGVQPARAAASTVVTMSSMSSLPAIVATPHLRRASAFADAYCSLPTDSSTERAGLYIRLVLTKRTVQSSLHLRSAQDTGGRTPSLLTDAHGCEGV